MNQLLIDYRVTFNSETGKKVMKDLEAFCQFNQPCFVRGEADSTAFSLGMRNVFLRIKKFVEADLTEEKQMEVEDNG